MVVEVQDEGSLTESSNDDSGQNTPQLPKENPKQKSFTQKSFTQKVLGKINIFRGSKKRNSGFIENPPKDDLKISNLGIPETGDPANVDFPQLRSEASPDNTNLDNLQLKLDNSVEIDQNSNEDLPGKLKSKGRDARNSDYLQISFRDLSKPMGMCGLQSRCDEFYDKFHNTDFFSPIPPFFYGSMYSSPAITLWYLIRMQPYADGAKSIQNGAFDLPDRLFFSMEDSYRNSVEEMSDVRELIPDFFY
jgi:hypothetical protein